MYISGDIGEWDSTIVNVWKRFALLSIFGEGSNGVSQLLHPHALRYEKEIFSSSSSIARSVYSSCAWVNFKLVDSFLSAYIAFSF